MEYQSMSREELCKEKSLLEARYRAFQGQGLKLNMARGKPAVDQLDLSMDMLDVLKSDSDRHFAVTEYLSWNYRRF